MKNLSVYILAISALLLGLYFIFNPIILGINDGVYTLVGNKPWQYHLRDNIFIQIGFLGCIIALFASKYAWYLVEFFAVGWLSVSISDFLRGIVFFDTFIYPIGISLALLVFLKQSFCDHVGIERPKNYLFFIPCFIAIALLFDLCTAGVFDYLRY